MLFILNLIEKYIMFRVLTVFIEVLYILLCFKLLVDSFYGRFFTGTKRTVNLRHNCIGFWNKDMQQIHFKQFDTGHGDPPPPAPRVRFLSTGESVSGAMFTFTYSKDRKHDTSLV